MAELADRLAKSTEVRPQDVKSYRSLLDAGEYGLALENLCTQLLEYDVGLDQSLFDDIRDLAALAGIDPGYWEDLRSLVTTTGSG